MFLSKLKDFFIKKIVKKRLVNVAPFNSNGAIKKVGIIIDETYFFEKDDFIKQLASFGIDTISISLLIFKNKIIKNEILNHITFSFNDLSWSGKIENAFVNEFIKEEFDLLISYYDTEKAPLLLVTNNSKANFKVGFSSVDKRLNHFMIDSNAENYKVFIDELFKYLKILNKL